MDAWTDCSGRMDGQTDHRSDVEHFEQAFVVEKASIAEQALNHAWILQTGSKFLGCLQLGSSLLFCMFFG